jgi:hypothetical protein
MAWTDEHADSVGLSAAADRVLGRWEPRSDIRPGWLHAMTGAGDLGEHGRVDRCGCWS